jgi:hypothetical protein
MATHRAHRIVLAIAIHALPALPITTTARGHRAVEHRQQITWRGVTSSASPPLCPWAACFAFPRFAA